MERVTVTASEPWDFVTHAGRNVFVADVYKGGDGHGPLLLRLSEPVRWQGGLWHWFVATRTTDDSCSLYGVTEPQATSDDWKNAPNAWRGQSPVARADVV